MKVLIIQENGRHDENRHMRECFSISKSLDRCGVQNTVWGLGHENYGTPFHDLVKQFDVVLSLENYDTGWMPDLGIVDKYKIFWSIDSHCALHSHRYFCQKSGIDLLLNSTSSYLRFFNGLSKRSIWFPNAVDNEWFRPTDVEKKYDVGFCGSIIADRGHWISSLEGLIPLHVATRVLGKKMIEEISSYRVSLNKSIDIDIPYRVFETTACQLPLVTNHVPDIEKLFNINEDIMVYKTQEQLVNIVKDLLNNEEKRTNLAIKGYQRTIKDHTYDSRIKYLLSIL